MKNIGQFLKKLFPRPNILQKRYIVLILFFLYWLFKIYVAYTPSLLDDELPDDIINSASILYADSDPFTDNEKQKG